ncbi:MAG: phosphatase PAP2 family protein [Lachnospiraceae bacterium]|nr:phosphatase PAP2 family protein [Lachnospiraceae bacterium]
MENRENKECRQLILFYFAVFIFFGIMLTIGTFYDETIEVAVYSPDNILAKIVTAIGAYPFFAFSVLFIGALCETIIRSKWKKPVKVILCIPFYLIATYVGFIGAGALVDRDGLGGIFPVLNRNVPAMVVVSLVSIPLLLVLGHRLAGNTTDRLLAKRIVCLLIILALSYAVMQLCKGTFQRPRYRLVVLGYDGIAVEPWYTPFRGVEGSIASFGIDKGEFRSFPSGHSILSMSVIFILQSLTWFSTKLKNRKFILSVIGLLFAVAIMFTRMVLGAHYLSDVSAGAMISTVFACVYTVATRKEVL